MMRPRPAREIWETALGELQLQVSKPNYRTWLEQTAGLSYEGKQFVIGVSSPFIAEYLEKNQRSLIEKTLASLTQPDIRVVFHINGNHHNSGSHHSNGGEISSRAFTTPTFNPRYTFATFITGSGNRLAHDAALSVAQKSGHSYNPLYIYGGSGLGKTHLLHAIGHVALASHRHALYTRAEQFTNEFITALRERRTEDFNNKHRNVDILLIDDIHFIIGKEQTAETFLHTFKELHVTNRQIVISSDCPPKSLTMLGEGLCSRFEWGLVADIQPPDFETRRAILQAKAKEKGTNMALEVLEFIAAQDQQNIRQLEGALNRVIAYAALVKAPPTLELTAQALQSIAFKEPKIASLTPELIIEAVAKSFQLTPANLKGKNRDRQTTLARHLAMYLLRKETNCSLAQTGRELGSREPIVVSHAYKKIAGDINTNPELRQRLSDIQQRIYQNLRARNK